MSTVRISALFGTGTAYPTKRTPIDKSLHKVRLLQPGLLGCTKMKQATQDDFIHVTGYTGGGGKGLEPQIPNTFLNE